MIFGFLLTFVLTSCRCILG